MRQWVLCFMFLAGCGIKSEIQDTASTSPGSGDGDGPTIENAVEISHVNSNNKGTIVHCRLNEALHGVTAEIPVFIEFEGEVIERKIFPSSHATVPFKRYKPLSDGEILCVIVYADAEFESEPLFIEAPE